jgi:hypothetical protein
MNKEMKPTKKQNAIFIIMMFAMSLVEIYLLKTFMSDIFVPLFDIAFTFEYIHAWALILGKMILKGVNRPKTKKLSEYTWSEKYDIIISEIAVSIVFFVYLSITINVLI